MLSSHCISTIQGLKISSLLIPELNLCTSSQNTNNAKITARRGYLTLTPTRSSFKAYSCENMQQKNCALAGSVVSHISKINYHRNKYFQEQSEARLEKMKNVKRFFDSKCILVNNIIRLPRAGNLRGQACQTAAFIQEISSKSFFMIWNLCAAFARRENYIWQCLYQST